MYRVLSHIVCVGFPLFMKGKLLVTLYTASKENPHPHPKGSPLATNAYSIRRTLVGCRKTSAAIVKK
jgi:hypothetical protein